MNWYDKAVDELEESLEKGEITNEEYRVEMRHLNDELRGAAEEAAHNAYNDVMGTW